ncbi:hypothetical protein ECP030529313_0284, partial [Escherichia coli p0305293.13]
MHSLGRHADNFHFPVRDFIFLNIFSQEPAINHIGQF